MTAILLTGEPPKLEDGLYEVRELDFDEAGSMIREGLKRNEVQSYIRLNFCARAFGDIAGQRIKPNPVKEIPLPAVGELLIEGRLVGKETAPGGQENAIHVFAFYAYERLK